MSSTEDNLVQFRRIPAGLRLRRKSIEQFARVLREEVAGGQRFSVRITGDAELRRLNREFLHRDYATDVLSFPAPLITHEVSLGDVAISAERAREQSGEHGHSVDNEIYILMLHGVLHLLGMDHERDCGQMSRAEAEWRTRLALPTGLIERVQA